MTPIFEKVGTMTDTRLAGMKNKHLVDLKREYENAIDMEHANVGRHMGYPLEADHEAIARIQARIAEIKQELASRGMSDEDGYTIVDQTRYDAWWATRDSSPCPRREQWFAAKPFREDK